VIGQAGRVVVVGVVVVVGQVGQASRAFMGRRCTCGSQPEGGWVRGKRCVCAGQVGRVCVWARVTRMVQVVVACPCGRGLVLLCFMGQPCQCLHVCLPGIHRRGAASVSVTRLFFLHVVSYKRCRKADMVEARGACGGGARWQVKASRRGQVRRVAGRERRPKTAHATQRGCRPRVVPRHAPRACGRACAQYRNMEMDRRAMKARNATAGNSTPRLSEAW